MSRSTPVMGGFAPPEQEIQPVLLWHLLNFMSRRIYVNLPVSDLARSIRFFKAVGFEFEAEFTSEKAACMIIGENTFAMLLTEPLFRTFTRKRIGNAHKNTEVLITIDASSRDEVIGMVQRAITAGGTTYMGAQDHDWMYQHSFADPDGHQWEVVWRNG